MNYSRIRRAQDSLPREDVDVCDRVRATSRTSEVVTIRETNVQDAVEPIRLVEVAYT